MEENNPYRQPGTADVNAVPELKPLMVTGEVKGVSVGQALGWLSRGMSLLTGHWGVIIGALVVTVLLQGAAGSIPLVGLVAGYILMMMLYGGVVKIFHRIDRTGESDFSDLFAGFSEHTLPLLLLGLLYFALLLVSVVAVVAALMSGGSWLEGDAASMIEGTQVTTMVIAGGLGFVLVMVLHFPFYFAVPLIFLGQRKLGEAMKLSTKACFRNLVPFLVYWLVITLISLIAAIPVFLGWLVAMPILAAAYYVGFKDIFVEE